MKIDQCPVCQSQKYLDYQRKNHLVKCEECGMVWDMQPPIDPLAIYQENYYNNEFSKGGYANYFEGMQVNSLTFKYRLLEATKKVGFAGKLLDVGCALGDCLLQAEKLGWSEAEGLEVSSYAVEFARKRGLTVSQGDLFHHNFAPASFDLVMLQDMIEHTVNPLEHLQAAYHLLKPGGWIFITTPNITGIWGRILGPFWYHYKPGEHLTYFSIKTVQLALKRTGFTNTCAKPTKNSMSLQYIFDRLQYYQPTLFGFLLKLVKVFRLNNLVFSLRIGELEAWGQKL